MRLSLLPVALCLATPVHANDGFGGLSATGLTFGKTDSIAMEEENLFIGIDRIAVDYVFRNLTDADVTGEVIFPLPPVGVWSGYESMMNLPEDLSAPDLVGFTATVDGRPVQVAIDRIAIIEDGYDEENPPSKQYDNPGRDVTANLQRLGIPLTLEIEPVRDALLALAPAQQAEAKSLGLAEFYPAGQGISLEDEVYAGWSIVTRYHWTQTFPAGATVRISHSYTNRPPGGVFYWTHPPEDWQLYFKEQYCIDEGTSKAMAKALVGSGGAEFGNTGTAYNISYVLRTANSWAGPIGRFTLTLDKGDPRNVISLCADGVRKTGPTTFVIEKTNYTPDRDLEILVVQPLPRE
ncbi:MAG: DUF4424 family protein [Tabrizicola flagellatus]|uniref:DUF4424 family protein n=1 Tax=Tabrizicola flagellatus TaxID=2593021 RepID=UPI00391B9091